MAPKRPGLWLPPSGSAAAAVGSKAPSPPPVVQTITAKTNAAAAKPMSEAMSLMAEMKFKQEKRDLRARLKKELDELTSSGVNDLLRIATLRGQLASVESFLAQTDGVQSLSQQAAAPPCPLDDSDSTNLYVGSLAPEWTEEMLMREFGRFGDVTSIKIMYPRTELQRLRGMNCGFVQFRTRKQAEGAKARLNGKECFGMCLRIDWGKAVQSTTSWGSRPSLQPHLQPHVEGPPVPVAPKGVPAATQPPQPERKSRWNKAKTIVVSIPEDKVVKRLVDKTAEFIALEGWDFEKQLLDRESENPRFAFLKCDTPEELDDPVHVYYRWRVFSYAQGDSEEQWRTEPFQVYDNGPLWQPPTCNRKERIVEEEGRALVIPHFDVVRQLGLGGTSKRRSSGGVGSLDLTPEEQVKLDELITGLTLSRSSVLAAMVFCLDASAASQQISQRICTSITEAQPGLTTAQLSARLFLLSDVLYNSHCTRPGASMYRRQFQEFLPEIFERLGEVCDGISTIAAAALRERVARLLRAWQEWSTFPPQFVKGLEATVHSRSDRPAADAEGSGVEISAEGKSTALQLRLQQWRSMTNIPALERACRLRGLATKGGQPELVERLCKFEAYWYSQEPEPLPAAVAAAAAAAAQWQQLLDEVVDPELDGEALDEEELKAIAAAGLEEAELEAQEAKEQSKSPDLLLCDLDPQTLIRSGDTTIIEMTVATDSTASSAEAADGPSAPTVETEREKEKEKVKERVKEKDKEKGKEKKTEKEQVFEQEGGHGGEDVEGQRQQARLRQVEKEVLAFQQSLEDAGERPDLVAMKCDRKRMQLLEAAARQEAMLEALKARGSGERPKPQESSKLLQEPRSAEAISSSLAASTGTVEEKAPEEKPKKAAGKEPDKTEKSGKAEKARKDTEKTEKAEKAERNDKDKAEKQENKNKKKRSRSHSRAAAPSKRKRSRSKSAARGRRKDDDRSSAKAGSSSAKERAGNRSRSRSHSGSRSRDRDRDRKGRRSRSHSRARRRR